MRQPVPGTVPIGGLKEDTAFFTGKGADGQFVATIPVTVDEALLERGRQRYVIYCQPCHDARGDGKGILFQRGNVPTATFHQEKILKYPDGQIFDVITNGVRADAGVPLADPSCGQVGDRRLRARAPARSAGTRRECARRRSHAPASAKPAADKPAGKPLREAAAMNGVMNRKLLFVLGPVTGLVMFGAVVMIATFLTNREYKEPYRAPAAIVDPTPRAEGLAAERAAAEAAAQGNAVRRGRVPALPRRREPRGHLGGGAAPPPVRGVRPCRPDLRGSHRGDRLQDG